MRNEKLEALKEEIKKRVSVETYLNANGIDTSHNFSCINPEHDDSDPSMGIDPNTGNAHCFGCGVSYDVIECIKALENLDFNDALKVGCDYAGISFDAYMNNGGSNSTPQYKAGQTVPEQQKQPKPHDISITPLDLTEAVKVGNKAFNGSQGAPYKEYLKSRGFDDETLENNKPCVFDNWNSLAAHDPTTEVKLKTGSKGEYYKLVLPYLWKDGKYHFVLGEISDRKLIKTRLKYIDRNGIEQLTAPLGKYQKPRGAKDQIYNERYLYEADKSKISKIFVCEGIYDCWSIEQAGRSLNAKAMGLIGAVGNIDRLTQIIIKNPNPNLILFVGLDNDNAGSKGMEKLKKDLLYLQSMNFIKGYAITPPPKNGNKSDWNEALQRDPEGLTEYIEKLMNVKSSDEAEQIVNDEILRAELNQETALSHINEFLDGIDKSKNTPAISTGFKGIDSHDLLNGGLYPGLYIMGAISSLGKTSLMLQIADNVAKQGIDVLYFSLEMARSELMSKSISRITYELAIAESLPGYYAKHALDITDGSRWDKYSDEEKQHINRAVGLYGDYARHLYFFEGVGDIGIDQIKETVEKYKKTHPDKKAVVFVDYLQILAPNEPRASDKQNTDKAVIELKRMSRDYNMPVFAISSLNRENYKNPISELSFKESGAIEYTSDALIGLQFVGTGSDDFSVAEAKAKRPREVDLIILKNRKGQVYGHSYLEFEPRFSFFKEVLSGALEFDDLDKKPKSKTKKSNLSKAKK